MVECFVFLRPLGLRLVDAIVWEKGQVAFLDKEKCTKCKSCYDACRFMAIE